MKNLASFGLIGLAYGGILVTGAADAPRTTVSPEAKAAAKQAERAAKALGRRDGAEAIIAAEAAVALSPRVAAYRLLLGQSYMQAGRFASGHQAFADTLALDDANGKAALSLALTQIAAGDWQAARATLTAHAGVIPAGDRGLAMALAGDTAGAVALLTDTARAPDATAKVRQNLALAYALAGQWQIARVVAAADISPADLDDRMQQWAIFAQPRSAADQVASLLGVQPAADGGQPATLALNVPASAPVAVAAAPVAPAVVAPMPPTMRFGPLREVAQALPIQIIPPVVGPVKVAATTRVRVAAARKARAMTGGGWYVQLGAYDNAGVARDAWGRARRRFAGWGGHAPNGVAFKAGSATYYRLSVGGFGRTDAVRACRQYKARGGDCFVRAGAGDQLASWAKPGVQVAMR